MDQRAAQTGPAAKSALRGRAASAQHSPIKTRAARRILSDRPTGNARVVSGGLKVRENRQLGKTTSDPGPLTSLTFPSASPSSFLIAPQPTASTSLLPPQSPYKPGSPGKRPRSPDADGQASPAKRHDASPRTFTLAPPIRSPPRQASKPAYPAFALSPPPPVPAPIPSLDDPFSASPSPPSVEEEERGLALRTRSVEEDLPLMAAIVAANQPTIRVVDSPTPALGDVPPILASPALQMPAPPLSPSQRMLLAMHDPALMPMSAPLASTSSLAPAAEIISKAPVGQATLSTPSRKDGFAMLGVTGTGPRQPMLGNAFSPGVSPRRGLQRSKSSPALGNDALDQNLLNPVPFASPSRPLPAPMASTSMLTAPTPVVERRLPDFSTPSRLAVPSLGAHSHSPLRRSPLSQAEMSVASRPSGIPRLAIIGASPAPAPRTTVAAPAPSLLSVPVEGPDDSSTSIVVPAGVSDDMAARLARMQGLMQGMGPSRRRSAPPPPKTPLTGGHALRRRSASNAPPSPTVSKKVSNGNMRRGSLLPIASASGAAEVTSVVVSGSEGEAGEGKKLPALLDVVAFVDVRTAEGDDAGQVFVDMLRSLGARIVARPSAYVTHVVFKSGKPTTLQRIRSLPEPRPHLVGVGWVVKCREKGERLPEADFAIEETKERMFQKKRKSMEPRNVPQAEQLAVKPMAAVERAKRLSMQFAPKVGSPLSKRIVTSSDHPSPATELTDVFDTTLTATTSIPILPPSKPTETTEVDGLS